MGHRAKHRYAALLQRVQQGRTIKSDIAPDGDVNATYDAARLHLSEMTAPRG